MTTLSDPALETLQMIARRMSWARDPTAIARWVFYCRAEPGPPREAGPWRLIMGDSRDRWTYVKSFATEVVRELAEADLVCVWSSGEKAREHYILRSWP